MLPGELETFVSKMNGYGRMRGQDTCCSEVFISEWNPSLKMKKILRDHIFTFTHGFREPLAALTASVQHSKDLNVWG